MAEATRTSQGFESPQGLVESTGRVALDAARVIRDPALEHWRVTVHLIAKLVREAGPLACFLCFFQGAFVTIQASVILGGFGIDRGLSGIIVASLSLRELTLITGTAALGASIGAGFVTELGAMRVSDEIDALDVMGLRSYPYLVSTRVIASAIAAIPIFAGAILATFIGGALTAAFQVGGMSLGSYAAFFRLGYAPIDLIFVLFKGVVATATIAMVCSSTGYRAKGGPVGVGMAVGEALNLTLVIVMFLNLLMSYLFWGISDSVKI